MATCMRSDLTRLTGMVARAARRCQAPALDVAPDAPPRGRGLMEFDEISRYSPWRWRSPLPNPSPLRGRGANGPTTPPRSCKAEGVGHYRGNSSKFIRPPLPVVRSLRDQECHSPASRSDAAMVDGGFN